jgi:hypothetical protein
MNSEQNHLIRLLKQATGCICYLLLDQLQLVDFQLILLLLARQQGTAVAGRIFSVAALGRLAAKTLSRPLAASAAAFGRLAGRTLSRPLAASAVYILTWHSTQKKCAEGMADRPVHGFMHGC